MTRTDVMASSRPRTAGAAPLTRRSSTVRALVALPIVLLMALALLAPGSAVAAEETSPYSQTPTTPKTTTTPTTPTTPSTGTSPSKEEGTPTTTTPKTTEPTTSSSPAKEAAAKTLPFTGFDLRWSFGIGVVLMGAGFSIVMMQRRRREGGR
ncbi:MAG: hypothetical protein QOK19_1490 [Solirubrobacteraceae bacterium]|nr:hypothetical protein [Solirubrobacterales bacterium]MEA2215929.1 hypothetical protein [Solirubrobacteraceae bacterium]